MQISRNVCSTDACNAKVVIVIFGGFLVHFALGAAYTFGNFAPYFVSYLRNRTDDSEIRNVDGLWIITVGSVGNCVGLSTGGWLTQKFGVRVATLLGALVFCGSVAINYFSVQRSFVALTCTYGLLGFLGSKLTYGPPVQTAIRWLPKHATLASGIVVSGTGGGSLVFNQIITAYINPENLSPNLIIEKGERYFTQPELLDRVPTCFLILAALYFGLQLIGIACMAEPPRQDTEIPIELIITAKDDFAKTALGNGNEKNDITESNSKEKPVIEISDDSDKTKTKICNPVKQVEKTLEEKKSTNHTQIVINGYDNEGYVKNDTISDMETNSDNAAQNGEKTKSFPDIGIKESLKKALTSRSFYIIWLTSLLINAGMQFIAGLYKAYGQTFIQDDHFLALVGSIAAIFNCTGRPIWGAVMDRFGFRVAIRCVTVGFVVLVATLLLTENFPKGIFMVWICGIFFFFCGIWSLMPSALAKLLSPQNMAINYGLIYTGISIASIIASVAGTSVKSVIGWHGLFYMAAGMGTIVFLSSFLFNGVDREGKRI